MDITPPSVIIDSTIQEQHLKRKVAVLGYAFDNLPIKDFDYYKLYYGVSISDMQEPDWKEDNFTGIKPFEQRNDTLRILNSQQWLGKLCYRYKKTLDI